MNPEKFYYDNKIVRDFALATSLWGIIGMLVGLMAAIQLYYPELNLKISYLTFSHIRPVHTNAVVFAFAGNGIFMGMYYSIQRLCKARMFSDKLSKLNFWMWQLIILLAAVSIRWV